MYIYIYIYACVHLSSSGPISKTPTGRGPHSGSSRPRVWASSAKGIKYFHQLPLPIGKGKCCAFLKFALSTSWKIATDFCTNLSVAPRMGCESRRLLLCLAQRFVLESTSTREFIRFAFFWAQLFGRNPEEIALLFILHSANLRHRYPESVGLLPGLVTQSFARQREPIFTATFEVFRINI